MYRYRNFATDLLQSMETLVPDMLLLLRRNGVSDGEKILLGLVDELTNKSFG